jgi:hypothetical protein
VCCLSPCDHHKTHTCWKCYVLKAHCLQTFQNWSQHSYQCVAISMFMEITTLTEFWWIIHILQSIGMTCLAVNPLAYTVLRETTELARSVNTRRLWDGLSDWCLAFNSSFLSVDGITCHISF